MARKRHGLFGRIVMLAILGLALVGGWTIWHAKSARDGYTAAKRTVEKAERA